MDNLESLNKLWNHQIPSINNCVCYSDIVNWIGGRIDAKVTTRVRPAEATYMYPLIAKPLWWIIQAVFEIETWAKINFPSYDHGCFEEERRFDFLRLRHHYVRSPNTPNEISQFSWRVMKKLGRIFLPLRSLFQVPYSSIQIKTRKLTKQENLYITIQSTHRV